MATRTIVSAAIGSSYINQYYYPGDTIEFEVSTDTGADATMSPTAARLTLSRVRSYSADYSLNVLFPGESTICAACTDAMAVNTDTHAPTVVLHSLDGALMSQAPGTIVLEVVGDTDDNCINIREGCVLTLEVDYELKTTACGAPKDVTLTISSSPNYAVPLTWSAGSSGMNNALAYYEIARLESLDGSTATGVPESFAATQGLSYNVLPPTLTGRAYFFFVRAVGTAGTDYASPWASCPTPLVRSRPTLVPYTDPVIVAGETTIKAAHITELQININRLRVGMGLAAYTFTAITAGITSLAGWSDHVAELRTAIDETGVEHDAWLEIAVNCPTAAVMMQLRTVEALIGTTAPAITTEASGAVVTLTDAAARVVQGLVTTIDPTTEGVTAVTLTRTGRNLISHLDYNITKGHTATIITEDCIDVTVPTSYDYGIIPVHLKGGVTYTLVIDWEVYGRDEGATSSTKIAYRINLPGASNVQQTVTSNGENRYVKTYTPEDDGAYDIICYPNHGSALKACSRTRVMLLEGAYTADTAPAFESCARQTLTVALPETVYGGTLDWTNGTLTITHDADGAELEAPETYQLDPQQLTLLKGYNALWSDAGDTAVTYIAGT